MRHEGRIITVMTTTDEQSRAPQPEGEARGLTPAHEPSRDPPAPVAGTVDEQAQPLPGMGESGGVEISGLKMASVHGLGTLMCEALVHYWWAGEMRCACGKQARG